MMAKYICFKKGVFAAICGLFLTFPPLWGLSDECNSLLAGLRKKTETNVNKEVSSQKVAANSEGAQRSTPILGASHSLRAAGDACPERSRREACESTSRGEGGTGRVPPFIEKVHKEGKRIGALKKESLLQELNSLPPIVNPPALTKNNSKKHENEPDKDAQGKPSENFQTWRGNSQNERPQRALAKPVQSLNNKSRTFAELSDEELIQYASEHVWKAKKSQSHKPPWTPPARKTKKKEKNKKQSK